jgi:hypothetical protein
MGGPRADLEDMENRRFLTLPRPLNLIKHQAILMYGGMDV